jgi:hypothetical protein
VIHIAPAVTVYIPHIFPYTQFPSQPAVTVVGSGFGRGAAMWAQLLTAGAAGLPPPFALYHPTTVRQRLWRGLSVADKETAIDIDHKSKCVLLNFDGVSHTQFSRFNAGELPDAIDQPRQPDLGCSAVPRPVLRCWAGCGQSHRCLGCRKRTNHCWKPICISVATPHSFL